MGVGLKTRGCHRRTWETARTHPRATTHQHQPGPWESLDMPWAIGWGLGAFPGIPWDVFFSLALCAFQGPPPSSLFSGDRGLGGCPAARPPPGEGGDISLFFPFAFFVRRFFIFFCFSCQVESPMRGRREGGPGVGRDGPDAGQAVYGGAYVTLSIHKVHLLRIERAVIWPSTKRKGCDFELEGFMLVRGADIRFTKPILPLDQGSCKLDQL